VSHVLRAKFDGYCLDCTGRIAAGEEIMHGTVEGVKGWIHVECPELPDEKPCKFIGTDDESMGY